MQIVNRTCLLYTSNITVRKSTTALQRELSDGYVLGNLVDPGASNMNAGEDVYKRQLLNHLMNILVQFLYDCILVTRFRITNK